jgi:mRNA-degrading endonuclease RelE of RelBE toxin-antitoxin system
METCEIRSSRSVAKDWKKLEENFPDAMEKCKKFLQESPLDRAKSNGKLKKLRGKYQGFLQYDIDDSNRVWYVVDNKERIVEVKYIGPHPK